MKKKYWIIIFIAVLVAHIAGIQLNNELLQQVSKPLIILVLAGYFLSQTKGIGSGLSKWILLALLFSWAGDVLLMFVPKNDIFFLLGLSAFLIAHIFYIIFFHHVRIKENVKGKPWLLVAVIIYYAALISLLYPDLLGMKIPVLVYGVVISFMFMLALHMLFIKDKVAGKWMMAGAFLFIISDSILAIDKFYQPFAAAGILIMLTYGLAQLFIVYGAIKYIRGRRENNFIKL